MYWPEGAHLIQSALVTAAWVSLPLLLGIAGAGLLAGYLQAAVGQSDGVALFPARLLGAAVALALLGAWMMGFLAQYWGALWGQAARLVALW